MQHTRWLGALGLVVSLVFALQVAAEDVSDFFILAKRSALFENGPVVINGNIGVNDTDGVVKLGAIISPVDPPLPIVDWPPFPVPPVDPCVNTQPDVTVPNGTTRNLPAGCFRNLRVGRYATLTLGDGTFNVRSVRLLKGSTLGGALSTVNVKGLTVTEQGVTIKDLTINTGSTKAAVEIGQNSTVDNVFINAPFGGIHLHMGAALINGSRIVAR